jgi:hypothetical protein
MKVFRRPSPAMIVAIVALIAALGGSAVAGGVLNKKKAKNIANNVVTQRAPGLSVASAKSADSANSAKDADKLGGKAPDVFETASGSDVRTNTLPLGQNDSTVLSATITTTGARKVTAVASVEASSDGGGNDNINCNIQIDAVEGARQTTYITPNTLEDSTTLPLTQALSVGAGSHTVIAECSRGVIAATSVEDRSLSVVATG